MVHNSHIDLVSMLLIYECHLCYQLIDIEKKSVLSSLNIFIMNFLDEEEK